MTKVTGSKPTPTAPKPSSSKYFPAPSLASVRKGDNSLHFGHQGAEVESLQRQLNASGIKPPLKEDGMLGPKTQAAIKRFQQQQGLKVDGYAGPSTLGKLEQVTGSSFEDSFAPKVQSGQFSADDTPNTAPTQKQIDNPPAGTQRAGDLLNTTAARPRPTDTSNFAPRAGEAAGPFAGNSAGREAQAEQLLRSNGHWPPREGETIALQIDQRQPSPDASSSERNAHLRSYTGQTSVFKYENGQLRETGGPFDSASHPGQKGTSRQKFTDIDGDGRDDIAHLRPGVYTYSGRPNGSGRFNPTDNRQMQVSRDTNHDGVIDAGERAASDRRGDYATALQWHAGGSTRPSSVGCQTMPPDDYARFSRAVGDNDGTFTYLMVQRPQD